MMCTETWNIFVFCLTICTAKTDKNVPCYPVLPFQMPIRYGRHFTESESGFIFPQGGDLSEMGMVKKRTYRKGIWLCAVLHEHLHIGFRRQLVINDSAQVFSTGVLLIPSTVKSCSWYLAPSKTCQNLLQTDWEQAFDLETGFREWAKENNINHKFNQIQFRMAASLVICVQDEQQQSKDRAFGGICTKGWIAFHLSSTFCVRKVRTSMIQRISWWKQLRVWPGCVVVDGRLEVSKPELSWCIWPSTCLWTVSSKKIPLCWHITHTGQDPSVWLWSWWVGF